MELRMRLQLHDINSASFFTYLNLHMFSRVSVDLAFTVSNGSKLAETIKTINTSQPISIPSH